MFPHNPAAFPRPKGWNGLTAADEHSANDDQAGMQLRDWFAGQALAGIIASHTRARDLPDDTQAAQWSYEYADAMLAERKKGGTDAS